MAKIEEKSLKPKQSLNSIVNLILHIYLHIYYKIIIKEKKVVTLIITYSTYITPPSLYKNIKHEKALKRKKKHK